MQVPPPYVPQLSGSNLGSSGPAGYGLDDARTKSQEQFQVSHETHSSAEESRPAQHQHPHPLRPEKRNTLPIWMILSIRERILLGLLLLGFIAIPATLPQASVDARQYSPSDPGLQSVERAEENFAGSAFYFIDPGYAIPQNYAELAIDPLANPGDGSLGSLDSASSPNPLAHRDATSSAHLIQPIAFKASLIDNNRALQCLTSAIYYEAGLEPDAGQKAVAQVVLNRVRHPSYPGSVCGVIFQGSERRTGCQFSYTCDGSLRRKPSTFHWNRARKVAASALAGKIASPVGTATHYHTTEIYPYWAPSLRFLGTIGAHRFYSWKGSAGKASAFNQRYRGREPLPAPKPKRYNSASSTLDPIALEKAYEKAKLKAQVEAAKSEKAAAIAADTARRHSRAVPLAEPNNPRTYQAPKYSQEALKKGGEKAFAGQKLPSVGQIKPEFRNAGTWKAKPGG